MQTLMRDNKETMMREAWQNGKCAYRWTKIEIDAMCKESGSTVPLWGAYPATKPGFPRMTPNAKVTGSPALSASPRGLPGSAAGDSEKG